MLKVLAMYTVELSLTQKKKFTRQILITGVKTVKLHSTTDYSITLSTQERTIVSLFKYMIETSSSLMTSLGIH
jgi:hypothetical protein